MKSMSIGAALASEVTGVSAADRGSLTPGTDIE
jgi:hypothetical protein